MTTNRSPKKKVQKHSLINRLKQWGVAFLIALVILLVIRAFLFQTMVIQTMTMSNTLKPGDYVLIDKFTYGIRLPITPIAIPFTPIRINKSTKAYYTKLVEFPYLRLTGVKPIERNAILAFNYPLEDSVPIDRKIVYAKRCVGLPGDTIQIIDNQLFVNGSLINLGVEKYLFRLALKEKELPQKFIDKYHLDDGSPLNNYGEYIFYLTHEQANKIKNDNLVLWIKRDKELENIEYKNAFPDDSAIGWTLNNFGPFVVPKAGMKLKVNKRNLRIYQSIIERYEKMEVETKNQQILINQHPVNTYVFKHNYYFMLDDNRDNAKDSRLWGVVPENHIIGKVSFIIFSFSPSNNSKTVFHWNRICKKVK